jgi:hypothetical protein
MQIEVFLIKKKKVFDMTREQEIVALCLLSDTHRDGNWAKRCLIQTVNGKTQKKVDESGLKMRHWCH